MGKSSDCRCAGRCAVCGAVPKPAAAVVHCTLCGEDSQGYVLQSGEPACLTHARSELARRTRARPPFGVRYGVLRVVGFVTSTAKHAWWRLRCSCGELGVYRADNVLRGHHVSCGEGECRADVHRLRRVSSQLVVSRAA